MGGKHNTGKTLTVLCHRLLKGFAEQGECPLFMVWG